MNHAFPTGNKDVDILFLSILDDRELLNSLNTNRATKAYANNEDLWRNRFKRLYPNDFEYVKDLILDSKSSWKDFSLSLIRYLDLAGQDYGIAMNLAAYDDNKDLIDFFIYKGVDNWNLGMEGAAQRGNRDLVDYFISRGADDWDWGLFKAAEGGHRDLVDFFITKGADEWDTAMYYAALGGHRDLVDYFISKGADNWQQGFQGAKSGGHKELIDFFLKKIQ